MISTISFATYAAFSASWHTSGQGQEEHITVHGFHTTRSIVAPWSERQAFTVHAHRDPVKSTLFMSRGNRVLEGTKEGEMYWANGKADGTKRAISRLSG